LPPADNYAKITREPPPSWLGISNPNWCIWSDAPRTSFAYVYLDATYLHVREVHLGQVVSKAVVVATGITATGGREVLGLAVGDSEEETFWRAFLTDLRGRGLSGVRLVISDQHAGLVAALRRCFQGAAHQRCRVHYADLRIMPMWRTSMLVTALSGLEMTA